MKDQWIKDLENLEKKVRNKIIKQAQKTARKPLAAKIKEDAPVDTGELEAGIRTKAGKRKKDTIVTIVDISTPEDNPHAARSEFGSRFEPAKPFIRPAVAELHEEIIETFMTELEKGIHNSK